MTQKYTPSDEVAPIRSEVVSDGIDSILSALSDMNLTRIEAFDIALNVFGITSLSIELEPEVAAVAASSAVKYYNANRGEAAH